MATKRGKKKCPKCLTLLSTADRCLNDRCDNYRKKVKVAEAAYKVTKTHDDVGTPDADEETIQAQNSGEAAEKAIKNDPRKGRYEKVTIQKDKGGAGAPRTEPQTTSKVKPKGLESVTYPYNLGFPKGFQVLFDALPKTLTENLKFGDRYGRLHIQVPDAPTLERLVEELGKKARGKTEVRHLAGTVVNGITESVKR